MNLFFSNKQEQTSPKSVLEQQISAEVELGIASSADPANANLPDLAPRITTINSPWFARTCRVCRDKFREGDQVRLCPDCGEPYHDYNQYDLHCWQKKFAHGAICNEGGRWRRKKRKTRPRDAFDAAAFAQFFFGPSGRQAGTVFLASGIPRNDGESA